MVALALLLSACSSAPASVRAAPPAGEPGGLTVEGTATVEAPPDRADLVATVTVEAAHPADAAHRVRARQNELVAALTEAGVGPADLAVSSLALVPVHDPDGRRVVGYEASITVTATTADFDAVGPLMEAAAEGGATELSTRFRIADLPALKTRAREGAVTAARAKAEQLATALGATLGPVHAASEVPDRSYGWEGNENFRDPVSSAGTHGDSQPVSVTVSVTFDLAG